MMSKPKEPLLLGAPYSSLQPPRGRKILRFVIPVAVLLCVAAFSLGLHAGLALHPKNLHVYISQAKLEHFILIGNRTIHSKLDATLAFRNPNKWACVHYKLVHATGFYEKSMFGSVRLNKFKQAHDSIKTLDVELEGRLAMPTNWRVEEFYEAKEKGYVDVEVRVYSRIKYKMGWLKTKRRALMAICGLNRVALASNGSFSVGGEFRGTRCAVYY